MLSRNLGQSGISVSANGLGCMGLSEFYGEPTQESEAINLLHRDVDLGITHFDTAEIYGQGHNEQLLGKAFAGQNLDRPTIRGTQCLMLLEEDFSGRLREAQPWRR